MKSLSLNGEVERILIAVRIVDGNGRGVSSLNRRIESHVERRAAARRNRILCRLGADAKVRGPGAGNVHQRRSGQIEGERAEQIIDSESVRSRFGTDHRRAEIRIVPLRRA